MNTENIFWILLGTSFICILLAGFFLFTSVQAQSIDETLQDKVRNVTSTEIRQLTNTETLGLACNEKLDLVLRKLDSLLQR